MIRLGPETCGNLAAASQREWLETNGLGGYASSTITGLNTRRYHGLLVAALNPPAGRVVLLSKLEETLVLGERRFELSVNRYPGAVHPQGFQYLKQFRLDPFPIFTYAIDDMEIEKSVFMIQGENSTVVQYTFRSVPSDCLLEIRPLIAFRDFHCTTHENRVINPQVQAGPGLVTIAPYAGLPALHFSYDAGEIEPAGVWYRNFQYDRERERGLDYQEDLYNPFVLMLRPDHRSEAVIVASTSRRTPDLPRPRKIAEQPPSQDEFVRALEAAAGQFIVARGADKTVIAGYHWFADWGRDAMISLPGLTLLTRRVQDARSILLSCARHVDQGLIPNCFSDSGDAPQYNTVDASLWFFEAVWQFLQHTNDHAFVRDNLYEVMAGIIDWHMRGTRFGIHLDSDGLLASGEPGVQLTWMDAKIGDWVVTPRQGKPVEIQALWYNALRIMEQLAGTAARFYADLADRARSGFNRLFWNEADGCLYDVIDGGTVYGAIRPNQVLALSLSHTMVPAERALRILEVVERELLTPYGLRTLSPRDPHYRGRYEGDQQSRDSAYHQGTVWPWLLGPFIAAYLRANGSTPESLAQTARWLSALREHLSEAGLGQISEIFDGDPPHHPRGAIAQAWSIAELLRATMIASGGKL